MNDLFKSLEEEEQRVCFSVHEKEQLLITKRSLFFADLLIEEKTLSLERAATIVEYCRRREENEPIYSFSRMHFVHVRQIIEFFLTNRVYRKKLDNLRFPLFSSWIEKMINYSLLRRGHLQLTDRDLRVAILRTLFSLLRQTIGSCFATAPLIAIQTNDYEQLINDLVTLIDSGSIKRTLDGIEHKAPISISTGHFPILNLVQKDDASIKEVFSILGHKESLSKPCRWEEYLKKQLEKAKGEKDYLEACELFKSLAQSPLMKILEYTLATFADSRVEFYKWNMYESLGLDYKSQGGLGEALYSFASLELEKVNDKREVVFDKLQQVKIRLNSQNNELYNDQSFAVEDVTFMKNYEAELLDLEAEAKLLADLYNYIIKQLMTLFPFYFQEVFDPELRDEISNELVSDDPAGFRLLYKAGRLDPTVWELIYDEKHYKQSLTEFFTLIERTLISQLEDKRAQGVIESLVTQFIHKIYEPEFLELSQKRVERLRHRCKIEGGSKKDTPWSYTSGGSLFSFLHTYRGKEVFKESFIPRSPMQLCIALIEIIKGKRAVDEKNLFASFLAYSPTHAFILRPTFKDFYMAIEDRGNTFSYVRDQILAPQKEALLLNKQITPFYFADTNWALDLFAFLIDPKTEDLALVRVRGGQIFYMREWNLFFDKEWGVIK